METAVTNSVGGLPLCHLCGVFYFCDPSFFHPTSPTVQRMELEAFCRLKGSQIVTRIASGVGSRRTQSGLSFM